MRTRPTITASDADAIVAACRQEATKNGWKVCIVVVDDGGHLVQVYRMDGANVLAIKSATLKAVTAAESRHPTQFWDDMVKKNIGFLKFPDHLPLLGGHLLMVAGECVGAVGIAGQLPTDDDKIAAVGAAAMPAA